MVTEREKDFPAYGAILFCLCGIAVKGYWRISSPGIFCRRAVLPGAEGKGKQKDARVWQDSVIGKAYRDGGCEKFLRHAQAATGKMRLWNVAGGVDIKEREED